MKLFGRFLFLFPVFLALTGCGGLGISEPPAPEYGLYNNPAALRPFFQRLAARQAGGPETLRILQLGDSHTAADFFSGRVREKLQAQFGNAGRGLLPPGRPYRGVREAGFRLDVAGRWEYENSLNPRHDGPFGISGFLARNRAAGATIAIDVDDGFDTLTLTLWKRRGGGMLEVRVDERSLERISTNGSGAEIKRWRLPAGARHVKLVALETNKPATILSYAIEKSAPGIVYDSLGVVGGTVNILNKFDPATLRAEIAGRDPALIVLAFGTNEAYADTLDEAAYRNQFLQALRAVRAAAPGAAIAVIGPPDVQKPDNGCRASSGTCSWTRPAALARVRAIQRDLATRENFFFWDWSSIMVSRGGVAAWAEQGLAQADRVHLSVAGYQRSADAFLLALMREFEAFKSGKPAS